MNPRIDWHKCFECSEPMDKSKKKYAEDLGHKGFCSTSCKYRNELKKRKRYVVG